MVESMTPSNLVYTSLVTLPKSGEWKTKACSFPYFFVLLWNYSTLSRLFLLSKENEVYFACRFTSVWLVIDLSMLLFSDSVMKILKKIQISFSVGNFLSFEKIKNQSMPLCTSQIFDNYYVDALSTSRCHSSLAVIFIWVNRSKLYV